jgi:hypothetical protein
LTDDPHAEGGEDGEEGKDEDGGHGGDSKREFGSDLTWGLILFRWAFFPFASPEENMAGQMIK